MRISVYCLSILPAIVLAFSTLQAQTQIVRTDFFPAELEFQELQKIQEDESIKDAGSLGRVKDGALFADVGFEQYARRAYSLTNGGTLSIEVVMLKDSKAAYSLLTLLRKSKVAPGPPGEFYSEEGSNLALARGYFLVRLQGEASPDLVKRVATSVSNRIGQRETALPSLISHLPKNGYDSSSLRYFLGPRSYGAFSVAQSGSRLKFEPGMEIAQARYTANNQTGTLSLISFPTHEMAEGYQESLEGSGSDAGYKVYVKRAGPLVGLLEGSFDPMTADGLLSSIHFTYSIKWIYDKNSRSTATIWGVPMPILHTVVRSIALVALLCLLSLAAGAGFAFFRVWLRGYAPHNILDRPERTEMTRLKLGPPRHRDQPAQN